MNAFSKEGAIYGVCGAFLIKRVIFYCMDNVIQIEVALNLLNDLFAKSVAFHDEKMIEELNKVRHEIYYGAFEYDGIIKDLKEVNEYLKKYE